MCHFSSDACKLPEKFTSVFSHLQYSTSCISVTVYITILVVCVRHEQPCLPSTKYGYGTYVFGLCVLILSVENTRKYYVHVTILNQNTEKLMLAVVTE
jgi:hypothetical protein